MIITTPISLGELVDKISILKIKNKNIIDAEKLTLINDELALLELTLKKSVSDSKINQLFLENKKEVNIVNPISSDLNVLRNSIFSNLIIHLSKNLDRGFKDISLFEIGPIFSGSQPGQQETVASGLRAGKFSRLNWLEKGRLVDVFDVKRDVIQSLVEAGFNHNKLYIDNKAPSTIIPVSQEEYF